MPTKLTVETILSGKILSRGIAIAPLYFFSELSKGELSDSESSDSLETRRQIFLEEVDEERNRFRNALKKCHNELESIKNGLEKEGVSEGVSILEAHLQMIIDPGLIRMTEKVIGELKPAEMAFQRVIEFYLDRFENIKDPLFKERSHDLRDIARRVQLHLQEIKFDQWQTLSTPSIIVADELSSALVAEFSPKQILGIVTEKGSQNSHAAILARAKGIPFLSGVPLAKVQCGDDKTVILDARSGSLILEPSAKSLEAFHETQNHLQKELEELSSSRKLAAETFDGYEITLSANIDVDGELDLLHQYGGQGVGLFRSEYVFLKHESFPGEEEQFQIYKNIVQKMKGLPIVIRTFDVGGDKSTGSAKEDNPYLGCRAIRFLLREQTIFKAQLRAILRAAVFGEVSLMFPMVSGLSELKEAKSLLLQVEAELEKEGLPYKKNIRLGSMIEVPSAAIISDLIAKECDFLSIGTNDLVQYSLAVDRGNEHLSGFYTPTHPGVIRLIKMVVTEANRQGIPVTVCGEIAADPRFTPLLLGLGVHELSVAARHIPLIKKQVRLTSIVRASHLAEEVLNLSDPAEIAALLEAEYQSIT